MIALERKVDAGFAAVMNRLDKIATGQSGGGSSRRPALADGGAAGAASGSDDEAEPQRLRSSSTGQDAECVRAQERRAVAAGHACGL